MKKVSFIIPTYNEEKTIAKCLDSLLQLDYPEVEIVVVDGGSKDKTREILQDYNKKYKDIKYFDTIVENKAEARNFCIKHSNGSFLFNYSGHVVAEKNLLQVIMKKFKPELIGVGCPNITSYQTTIAKTIGDAFLGFFAGGGTETFMQNATFQNDKLVHHIPFVCYRKEIFDEIGLFDTSFNYGQDAEFNIRVINAGYKLLYTPDTKIHHYKPVSLRNLFRKMYVYGDARGKIMKKHKNISFFHVMPVFFILGIIGIMVLFVANVISLWLIVLGICGYFGISIISIARVTKDTRSWMLSLLIYPIIHFGYGIGIIKGMILSKI